MLKKYIVFTAILIATLALSGCFRSNKPTMDIIVVSADTVSLKQGETVNLEVKGFDKSNKEMKVSKPTWSAAPENLGTLEVNGAKAVFTANEDAEGKVAISVTSGKLSDSIEITIFKDETPPEPDEPNLDELDQEIAQAESLLLNTEVGIYKDQAPRHAHHALETAVKEAEALKDDDELTQEDIDTAVATLQQAIAAFNANIVTEDDPIKAHTFVVDGNISHFVTQSDKGTIEPNTDPRYIKTGTESIYCNAIGEPFYVRVTDSHPNWIRDWREYDHIAAWFWVESAASLHEDNAIQFGYPMNDIRVIYHRSEFQDGWNEVVLSLRDQLALTDDELSDMKGLFEFLVRYDQAPSSENPAPPVYFDAIRVLKLVETDPVDRSDLQNAVQTATALKESTPIGTASGQAPQAAHDALYEAIDAAQAVLANETAGQADIDSAVQALQQAIAVFQAAIIVETDPEIPPEEDVLFLETFDNVPDGANIRDASVRSYLDNPDSIVNISGTMSVNDGVLEVSSQRFALLIPGLADAVKPVLRITIKNDNGSGSTVPNLNLAVGSAYSTGGTEFTAHGEYPITNHEFQVLEFELNRDYLSTGTLNFRGIVNKSGTAGLFIDSIEVVDVPGYQEPGDPNDPGGSDPNDPDPNDPDPEIPTDPPETIDDAYFGLVGWAAENGGTTGGAGCPEEKILFIDNGRDLYDALYANERRHLRPEENGDPYPLIICITGKITPDNTGEKKIDIKDQKDVTIIGYGDQGEFDGIGITIRRASNIIIRNLTIHHVNTDEKKSIDITEDSHHIWIDRCTFCSDLSHGKDYYDGLVDIKERAQYVTVSWCKFYNHYKTSLVGHNTDQSKAPDKVTYHHNYFYNVNSRTPLIRFATVHLFNNYFHNIVESGINVREGGKARIENNYFENVGSGNPNPKTGMIEGPIGWWYDDTKGDWEVIDNIFVDCPVLDYESTTTVSIPYDYGMALNTAERARELVLMYAGAGSLSLE